MTLSPPPACYIRAAMAANFIGLPPHGVILYIETPELKPTTSAAQAAACLDA